MANVNYIITANHYCIREGVPDVRSRILKLRDDYQKKRHTPIRIQMDKTSTREVYARIELGQWLADCECGGCEFVSPDEPIFFCFSCANRDDANMLRTVVFPPVLERAQIEMLLLQRPINDMRGLDDMERAHMARPLIVTETPEGAIIPLTRTWNVGESIEHLMEENLVIEKWKDELKKVGAE